MNKENKPVSNDTIHGTSIANEPSLPVDGLVSGNLYAALGHLQSAVVCLLEITEDLIDNNDARNYNARLHLEYALKYINDGKSR